MVDQVESDFAISLKTMKEVKSELTKEFVKGLAEDGQCVKMLPTFVHSLPGEKEQGDFMATDLGGTKFRVGRCRIEGGKIQGKPDFKEDFVADNIRHAKEKEVLFDFLAEKVANYIEDKGITETLPLGFTFSFPVANSSISSGRLIRWTKDYKAEEAVGKDPASLLRIAFDKKGVKNVEIKALINDTTGTLLAAAGKDTPDCFVGLILGTGTNACYLEKFDESTIPKYKGSFDGHTHVVINCEWGAFGEGGKLADLGVMTVYDRKLEENVENPGEQIYEKMISGKYLGEIVRLALKDLVEKKLLFGGQSSTALDTFGTFESVFVSDIERGYVVQRGESFLDIDCKRLLKDKLSIDASEADCKVVKRVCEAVSKRAARLAATGVVALVDKIKKLGGCTVAVDGSLYEGHPKFAKVMKEAMNELAPGNNIKMLQSEDGSGRGAAIAAAIACQRQIT